jgi:phosphoglycolate phosphatase
MVRAACAEAGIAPERTIMIGDTIYDAEMARGAGASAIGVSWGYHPLEALVAAGAHVVIDAFGELVTISRG